MHSICSFRLCINVLVLFILKNRVLYNYLFQTFVGLSFLSRKVYLFDIALTSITFDKVRKFGVCKVKTSFSTGDVFFVALTLHLVMVNIDIIVRPHRTTILKVGSV